MSDDDRMDRAERIRNMRQGNRAASEDGEDDGETGTDGDGPDETVDDGTGESPSATEPDARSAGDDPAGRPSAADAAGEATADGERAETPGDDAGTADEGRDPAAVARRAAESAAQVTGDGTAAEEGGATGDAATPGDVSATAAPMQGPSGVELPDQELLEAAMEQGTGARSAGGARATAAEGETTADEETVRVLEFALGEERYCLDIEYVEEIVKRESVTRVPNTPDYVEGVVDLRGQITTILEPTAMMDVDDAGEQPLIVVFDPDMFEEQGAIGWVVDEVRQVVPVAESAVNASPVDADYINGVVDRDGEDQFVIWVEPDDALLAATGDGED
ncbi:chemotaxis protein CheW [Haloarcula litorea]|uniref:chemotaxis protein CheW n=1 Tax=Haloarcula litorea TaxID=3032579 RepID=UPI0023E7D3BD|nr:chemotaxis protein CheW [Halomicroarcula sp. GDY20]